MAGRRHLGITASVFPRYLGTTTFLLTDSYSLITDSNNDKWVLAHMHWLSPMQPNYQCHMGIPWLLSQGHVVSSMYHHTGAVNHPFPGGGQGRCRKASSRYGIFANSTMSAYWVWMVFLTDCHVDAPLPGLPSHAGGCSLKATVTGRLGHWLAICLHQNEWCHGPHATTQSRAHLCDDWWPTYLEHLWLPAPDMHVAAAMWRLGGLPEWAKWGTGTPHVQL